MSRWDIFKTLDFEHTYDLDGDVVRRMIAKGELLPNDCIRRAGEEAWQRVSEAHALLDEQRSPAATPPRGERLRPADARPADDVRNVKAPPAERQPQSETPTPRPTSARPTQKGMVPPNPAPPAAPSVPPAPEPPKTRSQRAKDLAPPSEHLHLPPAPLSEPETPPRPTRLPAPVAPPAPVVPAEASVYELRTDMAPAAKPTTAPPPPPQRRPTVQPASQQPTPEQRPPEQRPPEQRTPEPRTPEGRPSEQRAPAQRLPHEIPSSVTETLPAEPSPPELQPEPPDDSSLRSFERSEIEGLADGEDLDLPDSIEPEPVDDEQDSVSSQPIGPPLQSPSGAVASSVEAPAALVTAATSEAVAPVTMAPAMAAVESEEEEEEEQTGILRRRPRVIEEFDLTPMVDMTFLLLLFFMLTASYTMQKTIQVPPPSPDEKMAKQAVQTLDDLRENNIIVTIDADNKILVDDEEVSPEGLVARMRKELRETGRNEVIVHAADTAHHEVVVMVYDAANEVGMQRIRLAASTSSASFDGP